MTPAGSDNTFENVRPGSFISTDCSPEPADPEFLGLMLNAPAEVVFTPGDEDPITGAFARMVVCGSYRLKFDTLGLNGDFVESIVLVAVDTSTHESYSGNMQIIENAAPKPPIEETLGLSPGELKDRVIGGYFNPNLAEVLELPEQEAEYQVYATLGTYKSNTVTIRVRAKN